MSEKPEESIVEKKSDSKQLNNQDYYNYGSGGVLLFDTFSIIALWYKIRSLERKLCEDEKDADRMNVNLNILNMACRKKFADQEFWENEKNTEINEFKALLSSYFMSYDMKIENMNREINALKDEIKNLKKSK